MIFFLEYLVPKPFFPLKTLMRTPHFVEVEAVGACANFIMIRAPTKSFCYTEHAL